MKDWNFYVHLHLQMFNEEAKAFKMLLTLKDSVRILSKSDVFTGKRHFN